MKTLLKFVLLAAAIMAFIGGCGGCVDIHAGADPGGRIVPEGTVQVQKGDDQTFTITPDDGYAISDVKVNDESKGPLATYTFTNLQEDHQTIYAEFSPLNAGSLAFGNAAETVSESVGAASFTVTRSNGSSGAVGVSYSTANGTATSGSDYTATSGVLTWGDGDSSSKTIIVPITDDSTYEPNETFTITLSSPLEGAVLGTPFMVTVTISNNDT